MIKDFYIHYDKTTKIIHKVTWHMGERFESSLGHGLKVFCIYSKEIGNKKDENKGGCVQEIPPNRSLSL